MGFETDSARHGITYWPFQDSRDVVAGAWYVYGTGVNADEDPGNVLARWTVRNTGSVPLLVAHTLAGAVNLDDHFEIPAGEELEGMAPVSRLVIYNPHGSTTGSYSLSASMSRTPTSSHPGHAVPLTADNGNLTADCTTVTADATEYV